MVYEPSPDREVDTIRADGTTSAGAASSSSAEGAYDSKVSTGHVGLFNQGATCYMNSLLQLFFHISYFREAVYRMTVSDDPEEDQIPRAIQNLFFQMQERSSAASTKCLTDAFGWDEREVFVQHDIQELAAKLRDTLEVKMKGTPAEGAINAMFTGYGEGVTSTLDGTYTSRRPETFYDIHLTISGYKGVADSFEALLAKSQLCGDNKYKVEEDGKPAVYKDAEMGYQYTQFPPVMLFHLKRFEMDMQSPTLDMKKVNAAFEFPLSLDLSEYEHSDPKHRAKAQIKPLSDEIPAQYSSTNFDGKEPEEVSDAIYDLYGVIVHRGNARAGHYYAYIREYNQTSGKWDRWLHYDDDEVREVAVEDATKKQFGGITYHWVQGRQVPYHQSNSAYILTYMRRSEIKKLIYPISTDAIPRHVKDELQRVMIEDERLQREEEERKRSVTFNFVVDEEIRRHVARDVFELLPNSYNASVGQPGSLQLVMQKTQTLSELYQEVRKLGFPEFRLWQWGQTIQNGAPRLKSIVPQLDADSEHVPLKTVFARATQQENAKPFVETLYIEVPKLLPPTAMTNLISFAVQEVAVSSAAVEYESVERQLQTGHPFKFENHDRQPTLFVKWKGSFPINAISFRVITPKSSINFDLNLQVALYEKDPRTAAGKPIWVDKRAHRLSQGTVGHFIQVYPRDNQGALPNARWLTITRLPDPMRALSAFTVSKVHVHTLPESIPEVQLPAPSKPYLPEFNEKQNLPVMLKLFNHRNRTISYLGMVIIARQEPIRNNFPAFKQLMGLPPGDASRLYLWDESRPYPCVPVQEGHNCGSSEANLFMGNILTLQIHPESIPNVYRFVQADQYYAFVEATRHVSLRNYKEAAQQQHQGADHAAAAATATPPPNEMTVQMQGGWRFKQIVEAVGESLNINPEYIRLYAPRGFHNVLPHTEPVHSETDFSLDNLLTVGQWPLTTLFYEVLDTKLKDVESRMTFPIMFTDYHGKALFDDLLSVEVPVHSNADTIVRTALDLLPEADRKEVLKRSSNSLVLVERKTSFIVRFKPVDLDSDVTSSPNPFISGTRPRRTHCYEIRYFHKPGIDEKVLCVGHGDHQQVAQHQPHGMPALMSFPRDMSCTEAQNKICEFYNFDEEDLGGGSEGKKFSLMIYTECMMSLPSFSTPIINYISGTKAAEGHPTHVMLNHPKPKDKPGSKYVPVYEPQLVLEKKKNTSSKAGDGGASPGSSKDAGSPQGGSP